MHLEKKNNNRMKVERTIWALSLRIENKDRNSLRVRQIPFSIYLLKMQTNKLLMSSKKWQ